MRGKLLGDRYRIQQKIGEGGMAYVFVAHDEKLNRKVAIKLLHRHMADNPDIRLRFFQEAQAISSFDHPNILKIFDFSGKESEELWMVTEILQGVNLSEYVQSFPGRWLHPLVAALIVREISKALEKAHLEGIIHRDVKPENIFVQNSGGIKLMDFGIAKNTRGNSITLTGTFMGSPSYMSPEQIRGKSVDIRSDIYSLGILFYEIATGKLPYTGTSTHDVVLKICEGKFREPILLNPSIPDDLNKMIVKAMAMYPSNRYQEAKSFARDLDVFIHRHGFEESHVELERFIVDRDKFNERLRKLSFTNQDANEQTQALSPTQQQQLAAKRTKTQQPPPRVIQPTMMFDKHEVTSAALAKFNDAAVAKPAMQWSKPNSAANAPSLQRRDHFVPRFKSDTRLLKRPGRSQKQASVRRNVLISQRSHRPPQKVIYRVAMRRAYSDKLAGLILGMIVVGAALAAIVFAYSTLRNIDLKNLVTPVNIPQQLPQKKQNPKTVTKVPEQNNPLPKRPEPKVVVENKKAIPDARVTKKSQNRTTPAKDTNPKPTSPADAVPSKRIDTKPIAKPTPQSVTKGTGELKISSRPAAQIFIDGSARGTTVDETIASNWISLSQGSHTLELRRDGYRTHRQTIRINASDRTQLPRIILEADSNYSVTLLSNVNPVRVQIINQSSGEQKFIILGSGSQLQSLSAGRYRIKFSYEDQVIERQLFLGGSDYRRSLSVNFKMGEP